MNELKKALTVLAYLRYSCHAQDNDGSIEKQRSNIKAYAEEHNMTIERFYEDKARSGTHTNRPALQQMKHDIQTGTVRCAALLTNKINRLHRNTDNMDADLKWFADQGIRIIGVMDGSDTATAAGMQTLKENADKAEQFTDTMSSHMRSVLPEYATACKHLGGAPPLGYMVDADGHYVIDEATAPIIRSIFKMYLLDMGYEAILQELRRRGYRTAKGHCFTKSSLKTILTNPKYMATYTYDRTASRAPDGTRNSHAVKDHWVSIPDGMPAIITTEKFGKVQEKMAANAKKNTHRSSSNYYALNGKLHCHNCGKEIRGKAAQSKGKRRLVYKGTCSCSPKNLNKEALDAIVFTELQKLLLVPENNHQLMRMIQETYDETLTQESFDQIIPHIPAYLSKQQTFIAVAAIHTAIKDILVTDETVTMHFWNGDTITRKL